MNLLAHCYLSGEFDEVMVGNLMGDFVKGKPAEKLSEDIKFGIHLHRKIDSFTDSHPIVRESKSRLFPTYRHYSSVIVDVFYDHFLASCWLDYSKIPLMDYAKKVYLLLEDKYQTLPTSMQRMFFYMQTQNWLLNYAQLDGIEKTLLGMKERASFDSGMEYAIKDLKKDYQLYLTDFTEFFPLLVQYVKVLKAS